VEFVGLKTSINNWINLQAFSMLLATAVTIFLQSPAPVAAAAILSFAAFWFRHRGYLKTAWPLARLGNGLTALRLMLILFVAFSIDAASSVLVFVLFLANISLDVADGYAARNYGRATEFGAAFDLETDAFFVLVAGLYFYHAAGYGPWVLIPGLLRYGYRLAAWSLKGERFRERRRPLLARLAGVNFGLITLAVILPATSQYGILLLSTGLVSASFAISFWELCRISDGHSLS